MPVNIEAIMINTTTQLLLLLMFTLSLNFWSLKTLSLIFFALLISHLYLKNMHYYRLMKRLKWFYAVMFILFVFNTPGQHLPNWPAWAEPTYEGIEAGIKQFIRVATILGVLSLVLINNNKQQLISGLYFLIRPMSFFGFDVKRFSARLWLTLHYVELHEENNKEDLLSTHLSDSLSAIFADDTHDDLTIELEKPEFTRVDLIALLSMLFVSTYIIWSKGI